MPDADRLAPADQPTLPPRSPTRSDTRDGKRVHNADEIMAKLVARRLVEHLERPASSQ